MKKIIVLFIMSMLSTQAFALTLKDVVGTYKITHSEIPMMTFVSIETDGTVDMLEMTEYGPMECSGTASVSAEIVSLIVDCQNGVQYTQQINLQGVEFLKQDTFSAPVISSLYNNIEMMMNFERVVIPED